MGARPSRCGEAGEEPEAKAPCVGEGSLKERLARAVSAGEAGAGEEAVREVTVVPLRPELAFQKEDRRSGGTAADVGTAWLRSVEGYKEVGRYLCQWSQSNGPMTGDLDTNAFLTAFRRAYDCHGDLMLSPDDVWMVICLNVSQYINANPEKLRSAFVQHEGKKELEMTEPIGKAEDDWDEFFGSMFDQIKKNTKGDISETIAADFSTTGKVELLLSHAVVMDSFKAYFNYRRFIPLCGIRNLHLQGSLNDWKRLAIKADALASFVKDGGISSYISGLRPILRELTQAKAGKPDVGFWDKVMNMEHGPLGSGSTTYISGWVLKFYIRHVGKDKVDSFDIELNQIKVPVKVVNHSTSTTKTCQVVGGFCDVDAPAEGVFKPVMSIAVLEDTHSREPV